MADQSLQSDTTGLNDDAKAEQTMERLRASSKWLQANFWPEWQDAFRSYEVKAEQLTFPKGHPRAGQEDKTRTNVAMPEFFIAVRRKAVRKSRRPPSINIRSESDELSQFLSKMATLQWDRAGEQRHQRRHVLQGDLLGISLKVHYYDQVSQQRTLRYAVDKVLNQMYAKIHEENDTYNVFSATEDEPGAIRADKLNPDDQAKFLANMGPETQLPKKFSRFDGPLSDWIFIGDWYPEPEFDSIHGSAWHIFEGVKDAEWLAYMCKQTYKDPWTGEQKTILDEKKLKDLVEYQPLRDATTKTRGAGDKDFRQVLRDVIFKTRPEVESRLIPGRRYLIHSEYTFRRGIVWVRFIGSEKILLGEMPIPWDLGGRYPISCYCPMPSLLHGIGDSTARKGRHLWKLHNVTVSQRTDLITQALKKIVPLPKGADLPDEMLDLGLMRVVFSDNYREILQALSAAGVTIPREAWESEQQIMRMEQMLEPSMIDFGQESQALPASQRVATLGLLQQKAQDTISADELEALNDSIAEETDIKMTMWQSVINNGEVGTLQKNAPTGQMPDAFWTITGPSGSQHPRKQISDALELQVDFEVFPELGSTLALDDQVRKQAAMEIYERAITAPQVWNVQEAAKRLAHTYGVPNPEDLLAPPPQEPPPPPPKVNIGIALKIQPTSVEEAEILQMAGVTPDPARQLTQVSQQLDTAAQGADAAQRLLGDHPDQLDQEAAAKQHHLEQKGIHAPPPPEPTGNGTGKKKTSS